MLFKSKDTKKELTIHIDAPEQFEDGTPLLFGTTDKPARIQGKVYFKVDADCMKGAPDVEVTYTSAADVDWITKAGEFTLMGSGYKRFDAKKFIMPLQRTSSGLIKKGTHSMKLDIPIDPSFPSSMVLDKGKVAYTIKAKIVRKFPKKDILVEKRVWVMNSHMPAPHPVTVSEEDPTKRRPALAPYFCELPTSAFYAGETFPIVIYTRPLESGTLEEDGQSDDGSVAGQRLLPSGANGGKEHKNPAKIVSITTTFKQTDLFVDKGEEARQASELHAFECIHKVHHDDSQWAAVAGPLGGRQVIWVTMPGLWDVNSSFETPCLTVSHRLRVNLELKTKNNLIHKTLGFRFPLTMLPPPASNVIPWRFQGSDGSNNNREPMPVALPLKPLVDGAGSVSKAISLVVIGRG